MTTHTFVSALQWVGSTGVGYGALDRTHTVRPGNAEPLRMSSAPAFNGDPALPNPEELLLAAASSCQFLAFVALAARARIDVVQYEDDAQAQLADDVTPTRVTEIVLRPRIVVRGNGSERVPRLVELAHRHCFVANSLSTPLRVRPVVEVRSKETDA